MFSNVSSGPINMNIIEIERDESKQFSFLFSQQQQQINDRLSITIFQSQTKNLAPQTLFSIDFPSPTTDCLSPTSADERTPSGVKGKSRSSLENFGGGLPSPLFAFLVHLTCSHRWLLFLFFFPSSLFPCLSSLNLSSSCCSYASLVLYSAVLITVPFSCLETEYDEDMWRGRKHLLTQSKHQTSHLLG